ncbi:MAG TPA: TolC family protein [Bacteroidales bacterium]|nr:TolC family protein [Bacteroidales bacterium]
MKRIAPVFALIFLFCLDEASGQEKEWTIEDCINYAITNNLDLKRQILQTETAEVNFLKSKMDILPSLNLGSDANLGFGRSIDPVTNLITFEQNISNSYALNSNFQLFTGFNALNTIAANKFMLKAGLEAEKVARNTLVVELLGQYYQVLYARGLEEVARQQLELSERQQFRITRMVETGKEAMSRQMEMESQVSADRLDYTIARNTANQAITILRQMLQLDPGTVFRIALPDPANILLTENDFKADSVYRIAAQTLPRLRTIEYELKAAEKQISAARGLVAPSLTVGGSVYTGYYKVLSDDSGEQAAFTSQLKNNNSQAIYVSLDIPLFNNYNNGRNIKTAKIRKTDAALRLELEKNALYTEIENACLNYSRGMDEYVAAQSNFEFNKKSFNVVEKKFESGLVDVTDYSAAKTTLSRAETEALRTKLQLRIREIIIQFYMTGNYESISFI